MKDGVLFNKLVERAEWNEKILLRYLYPRLPVIDYEVN